MQPQDRASSHAWRLVYSLLAWASTRRQTQFQCMNWGYAEDVEAPSPELAAHPERYPLQLYHRVVAGVELTGRELVEVSCGRGGGLTFLHRTRTPARSRGIDFTPANIRLCRGTFGDVAGITFEVGRAEQLPIPNGSADLVISVEASHCYGDVDRFLAEVARVLRPGGRLRWADFRPSEQLGSVRAMASRHLRLAAAADLTAGVVRALERDGARRRELIKACLPRLLHRALYRPLAAFAGAESEASTVRNLRTGAWHYFWLDLIKE